MVTISDTVVDYDTATHYDLIAGWWRARGVEPMAPEFLPVPGGYILVADESPVAATWYYLSLVNMVALRAWTTTAPGLAAKDAKVYIARLHSETERIYQEIGYRAILTMAQKGSLAALNRELGWKDMETVNLQILYT